MKQYTSVVTNHIQHIKHITNEHGSERVSDMINHGLTSNMINEVMKDKDIINVTEKEGQLYELIYKLKINIISEKERVEILQLLHSAMKLVGSDNIILLKDILLDLYNKFKI